MSNHIHIKPEWVPRDENQLADFYSRIVDYDDYRLNPLVFAWLDGIWGPHTIDRFASPDNAQTQHFNSRFWSPGSEAIDAFTCSWADKNNWWFPPVYLVPRVLKHARNS